MEKLLVLVVSFIERVKRLLLIINFSHCINFSSFHFFYQTTALNSNKFVCVSRQRKKDIFKKQEEGNEYIRMNVVLG